MPEGWGHLAACRGVDVDLFFPKPSTPREKIALAMSYCLACPVRSDCLDYAMADDRCVGIWGATTLRERNRMRAARRRVVA